MDAFNPDLLRTMQQAMELSKMFGADTQGGPVRESENVPDAERSGTDTGDNFNRIIEMMNLLRSMQSVSSPQNRPPDSVGAPQGGMFADAARANAGFKAQPGEAGGRFGMPADRAKAAQKAAGGHFDARAARKWDSGQKSHGEIHMPALDSIKAAIPYLDGRYRRYMGIFVKLIEIQRMMELYSQAAAAMCSDKNETGNWRRNMLEAIKPHMDENKADLIDFLMKLIEMKEVYSRVKTSAMIYAKEVNSPLPPAGAN